MIAAPNASILGLPANSNIFSGLIAEISDLKYQKSLLSAENFVKNLTKQLTMFAEMLKYQNVK